MKKWLAFVLVLLMIPVFSFSEVERTDDPYEIEYISTSSGKEIISFSVYDDVDEIVIPDHYTSMDGNGLHWLFDDSYYFGDYFRTHLIIIPNSLVTIKGNPFSGYCNNNLMFQVAEDHPTLAVINGCLIDKTENRLIYAGADFSGIPDGVEILGEYCGVDPMFGLPESVTTIMHGALREPRGKCVFTIPKTVTTIIGNPKWLWMNYGRIVVDEDHPIFELRNGALIDKTENRLICLENLIVQKFTVPDGIEKIDDYAMCDEYFLVSVSLPESLKEIGAAAFSWTKLAEIKIPESVSEIGEYAFASTNLQQIDLPDGIGEIKPYTFECTPLQSINLPASIREIGENAFHGCSELQSVEIPDGVRTIGEEAFGYCEKLKTVTIAGSVEQIGKCAFDKCDKLESVTILEGIKNLHIDPWAFAVSDSYDPRDTLDFVILHHIRTLNKSVFGSRNVEIHCAEGSWAEVIAKQEGLPYKYTLQASIRNKDGESSNSSGSGISQENQISIGKRIFDIDLPYGIDNSWYPGVGYLDDLGASENELISFETFDDPDEIVLPDLLDTMAEYGNCGASGRSSAYYFGDPDRNHLIIIPNGLTTIKDNPFRFYDKNQLQFQVAEDHPTLAVINGCLIDKTENRLIYAGTDFSGIPDGVEILGEDCYVPTVEFPDSVTTIMRGALVEPSGSNVLTIPKSVTKIIGNPISHWYSERRIIVEDDHPTLEVRNGALIDKTENRLICLENPKVQEYTVPDGIEKIDDYAMCWSELVSVSLPEGLKEIGASAFDACLSLAEIKIPESVTEIGEFAFCCTNLQQIDLPDGIGEIKPYTFACTPLQSINLPASIREIGENAFRWCSELQSVEIPEGVKAIEEKAFCACEKLKTVRIAGSVEKIGKRAFNGCDKLESVTIMHGDKTQSIGEETFGIYDTYDSVDILTIVIPGSVKAMGKDAFGTRNVEIQCAEGSAAERYAKKNDLPYKLIEP